MTIASWLRRFRRRIVGTLLAVGGVAALAALGTAAQRRRRQPVQAESTFARQLNRLLHQPSEDVAAADLDAGEAPVPAGTLASVSGFDAARVEVEADANDLTDRDVAGRVRTHLRLVGEHPVGSAVRVYEPDEHPAAAAAVPPAIRDGADPAAALGALAKAPQLRRRPDPDADPADEHSGRSGRRRAPLVVGGVLVVAVLAVAVAVALGGSDDGSSAGADEPSGDRAADANSSAPSPPPVDSLAPAELLTTVADGLEEAGSFRYDGMVAARDITVARPGPWLAVNLSVTGAVDLVSPGFHEIAQGADGAAVETIADGTTVWGHQAESQAGLVDADYEPGREMVPPTESRLGLAQLPVWLRAAADPVDAPRDPAGRRVVQAVLPAAVLGETIQGEAPVDATVLVSVDAEGNPVHLELDTGGDNPNLHLAVDLSAIGDPVTFEPPTS
jgi:hypothetical protein